MIVVLGLGNPGSEYEDTRHNVGFMVADKLAAVYDVKFGRTSGGLASGPGVVKGKEVLIAKPMTFMNKSGVAAKKALRDAGIDLGPYKDVEAAGETSELAERLIVVTDDCDLPFGTIRLRKGGGSGGQRGIKSIIEWLGTDQFSRLRVGVGRPANVTGDGLADYVLSPFNEDEEKALEEELTRGVSALESFIEDGIETAMNRYN